MTEGEPPLVAYPLGVALWAAGIWLLLSLAPPEFRGQAFGLVLFLLPLAMAVLALLTNALAGERGPAPLRPAARTLTFALLFPFVLWGQWDARRRKPPRL